MLEHFGPAARMIGAGIRNTTNATMLEAGYKHNVVPAEAVAYIDGRFLPGQGEAFQAEVQRIVGRPRGASARMCCSRRLSTPSRAT